MEALQEGARGRADFTVSQTDVHPIDRATMKVRLLGAALLQRLISGGAACGIEFTAQDQHPSQCQWMRPEDHANAERVGCSRGRCCSRTLNSSWSPTGVASHMFNDQR